MKPLRKCKFCGLEAHTEKDLELFIAHYRAKHGYVNICKNCHNHPGLGEIRAAVKERANYECEHKHREPCKGRLAIHHIDEDPDNNVIENLLYLCARHHHRQHYPTSKHSNKDQHNYVPDNMPPKHSRGKAARCPRCGSAVSKLYVRHLTKMTAVGEYCKACRYRKFYDDALPNLEGAKRIV